jgi:hypothetical protein
VNKSQLLALILPLISLCSWANTPVGFTWVNLETNDSTMRVVRRALNDVPKTSIREVGVEDGFALVMVTLRESDASTPDGDQWFIYNVSLKTASKRLLVFGYGVKVLDWIGSADDELAISYYDCWECEAATLFTALHFRKGVGWRARWSSQTQDGEHPQPGAVAFLSEMDQVSDFDEVDQVFAIVSRTGDTFAAGYWCQLRNTKTNRLTDNVARYSFDPKSGSDRVEKLTGSSATDWERLICSKSDFVLAKASLGQNSKACRKLLKKQP